jgi:two-component system LytT family sensor kinase
MHPNSTLRAAYLTMLFALVYAGVHAIVLSVGAEIPFPAALTRTTANAVLWFAITPAVLMGVRRATRRGRTRTFAQIIVGIAIVIACGVTQSEVATLTGIRWRVPALAGVFYYLDVNIAATFLAAAVLHLLAQHRALVARDRWLLALDARLSEARSRFLAFQLQPHFLFNALNLVVALAADAPRDAAQMLRHLRTLLLSTARRSRLPWITLRDELDVLDAYLDILAARHSEVLRVERAIAPEALEACIPPLALQPLVENAIRHALAAADGIVVVRLAIFVDAGRLHVVLSNSFVVEPAAAPGLGIGLRNTRERLARFFQDDYTLSLSFANDRAMLSLDVPFRRDVQTRSALDARTSLRPSDDEADVDPPAQRIGAWRMVLLAAGIVVFWTCTWLFWAYQMYFYRRVLGSKYTSAIEGSWADMVSAMVWIVLTPVALAAGYFVPIRGKHWLARALMHIVLAGALSLLQIRLIMASGQLMRPLFSAANFNQLVLNCLIYGILVSITHRRAVSQWFQERQTAERRLEAEIAHANWQAAAMEAQPALIAEDLDRLALLMDGSPDAAEEQVLALADSLRQLLRADEREAPQILFPLVVNPSKTSVAAL